MFVRLEHIFLYLTLKLSSDILRSSSKIFSFWTENLIDKRLFPTIKLLFFMVLKCIWWELKTWLKFKSIQSDWGWFVLYNLCKSIACLYNIICLGVALLQDLWTLTKDLYTFGFFCESLGYLQMKRVIVVLMWA